MRQHKHRWQATEVNVELATAAVEVRFSCMVRRCQGSISRIVQVRKPAATALTDAERAERAADRARDREIKAAWASDQPLI